MRIIIPIILIILSIGLFFGYIDSAYDEVTRLRGEVAKLDVALDRIQELEAIRKRLLDEYNSFSREDRNRLEKLLPDHIDSVRLVIDIDNIAAQRGLRLSSVGLEGEVQDSETDDDLDVALVGKSFGTLGMNFTVNASYEQLKSFLRDLEDSLRIVDVSSITFSAGEEDLVPYSIAIKTYWLK